ncbi:jg8895 [Pararge aegeria aegeria]|uniref:Jg8895 protein n=1 Tax=Pararge aegeria aegeria TaxID=348720 RepID=A0A8S4SDW9_9NEOP|nr:jg8895 [Pararge aegeria aegeria]
MQPKMKRACLEDAFTLDLKIPKLKVSGKTEDGRAFQAFAVREEAKRFVGTSSSCLGPVSVLSLLKSYVERLLVQLPASSIKRAQLTSRSVERPGDQVLQGVMLGSQDKLRVG